MKLTNGVTGKFMREISWDRCDYLGKDACKKGDDDYKCPTRDSYTKCRKREQLMGEKLK